MPKKLIPLIVAIACGLLAVFLINVYIQKKTSEEIDVIRGQQENVTTMVVAREDIPQGTVIKEGMLEEKRALKQNLQPYAAVSIDRVVDKIALAPISRGEQILLNKLTVQAEGTSLAMKIPGGKRAITITVDNVSSVGGMIRPGDHVDVIGMVPMPVAAEGERQAIQMATLPLFQDVLVLAVGQEFTVIPGAKKDKEEKEEKTLANTITLALSPQETNLIAYVQEQGRIRLVLRSPGDTQIQPPIPGGWQTLFRTLFPRAYEPQPKADTAPGRKVEIIRGTQEREEQAY